VMAKTNEYQVCQELVMNYLYEVNHQCHACNIELTIQSQSCPSILLPLQTLDNDLKGFVYLQRKYLSQRKNDQLIKFKHLIHEKELFQNLSIYNLIADQVY